MQLPDSWTVSPNRSAGSRSERIQARKAVARINGPQKPNDKVRIMKVTRWWALTPAAGFATLLAGILSVTAGPVVAEMPGGPNGGSQAGRDTTRPEPVCEPSLMDSPYIPVDNWIYPAVLRLY